MHTIISYMEMFYELYSLEIGFYVQMNTHTHNQSPIGNVLWVASVLISRFQVKWKPLDNNSPHLDYSMNCKPRVN